MARPGKKKRRILFAVEIIVLLLFVGGLYVYGQLNSKLEKLDQPNMDRSKIQVNQEVQDSIDSEDSKLTGYSTYALFGIDKRDHNAALNAENSDTMIIASVNNDTKEVKLVSVYRDTLLNVGTFAGVPDTYTKANAAYAAGGPEQAISMLNTNLDLNITDYATVNFDALSTIVDDLGGLDMDMSYAEIVHMNNYCEETSEDTGKSYTPIELPERPEDIEKIDYQYHLNGVQVTSYCRIRYTASLDMGRTERQRKVIQMIVHKAVKKGLPTIFNIMDDVFPMISTSMDRDAILKLLPAMVGYSIDETTGFPAKYKFSNVKGSVIVPTDLESNVIELHKFLYGDEAYTPSSTVKANSQKILEVVGGADKLDDVQKTTTEEDNNTTVIFQQNDDGGYSDVSGNYGGGDDTGSGGDDPNWSDPGTGGGDDPGTGGGEEPENPVPVDPVDPGSGGDDPGWSDPGTGGGDDPGTGGGDDPGTGGGDWVDPGTGGGDDTGGGGDDTGGGDWTDPGTGGGDDGGGDWVDPGTGGDDSGGSSGGGDIVIEGEAA